MKKIVYLGLMIKEQDIKSGGDRYIYEIQRYLKRHDDFLIWDLSKYIWDSKFTINAKSIFTSIKSNIWAIKELSKINKGDIVVTNAYYKTYFVFFPLIAEYIKKIHVVVGVNAFYYTSRKTKFLNILDKWMMWVFLKPATIVVANSEGARNALIDMGINKQKIEVVAPRIELPPEIPEFVKEKTGSIEILYVGRVSNFQKTHTLIDALSIVKNINFVLHVAGEVDKNDEYVKKIELKISNYIFLLKLLLVVF